MDSKWRTALTGTEDDLEKLAKTIGEPFDFMYLAQNWLHHELSSDMFETYMQLIVDMRKFVAIAAHRFHFDIEVDADEVVDESESETESAKP